VGFVRKATIISTGGLARAGGLKGKSKKEREAEAHERMAKVEEKRFKAEKKAMKADQKSAPKTEKAYQLMSEKQPALPSPIGATAVVAAAAGAPHGPPPGWYLDPEDSTLQRWWDGTGFTEVRQPVPPTA
jgi:hypothetical protein